MIEALAEYRYSSAALGRARLLFAASIVLLALLLFVVIAGWQSINPLGRVVGIGLTVVMLATARAQLGRLGFRLRLGRDTLEICAPLGGRSIAWSEIAEVRRIVAPRMLGPPVWVCAVTVRGRRGTAQPVFVFDSGLERAEQAFDEIAARGQVHAGKNK